MVDICLTGKNSFVNTESPISEYCVIKTPIIKSPVYSPQKNLAMGVAIMLSEMWDEFIYPFPNFNGATVYPYWYSSYRKSSNINPPLVGNEIVDRSDVVGASPFGAAPTTSSLST